MFTDWKTTVNMTILTKLICNQHKLFRTPVGFCAEIYKMIPKQKEMQRTHNSRNNLEKKNKIRTYASGFLY